MRETKAAGQTESAGEAKPATDTKAAGKTRPAGEAK
jgi:hypothetical protein